MKSRCKLQRKVNGQWHTRGLRPLKQKIKENLTLKIKGTKMADWIKGNSKEKWDVEVLSFDNRKKSTEKNIRKRKNIKNEIRKFFLKIYFPYIFWCKILWKNIFIYIFCINIIYLSFLIILLCKYFL